METILLYLQSFIHMTMLNDIKMRLLNNMRNGNITNGYIKGDGMFVGT